CRAEGAAGAVALGTRRADAHQVERAGLPVLDEDLGLEVDRVTRYQVVRVRGERGEPAVVAESGHGAEVVGRGAAGSRAETGGGRCRTGRAGQRDRRDGDHAEDAGNEKYSPHGARYIK